MPGLAAIVRHLDDELRTSDVPDYDAALNGLQLANNGRVTRIAASVDFAGDVVTAALESRADLLVVHHGMFWGGTQPIVGHAYDRLQRAIKGNLAVYSSHLPLDLHPTLGNNALLATELGLSATGTFGRYKGIEVGVCGSGNDESTAVLFERVRGFSSRFRTTAVSTPFDSSHVTRRWAIITGAGASSDTLAEAAERKIDTLIVGEGPHHSAVLAREIGVVVMYAGHYATETLGVRALAEMLTRKFDIPNSFVDLPTGL